MSGGQNKDLAYLKSCESFRADRNSWLMTADMNAKRASHTEAVSGGCTVVQFIPVDCS